MGFLSSLLKIGGTLLKSPVVRTLGAGLLGGAAFEGASALLGGGDDPVQKALAGAGATATTIRTIAPGAGVGNINKNTVITRVMTISPSGVMLKQEDLPGRPFLMNKDIVTAKRVFRAIRKADQRLPRKPVGRRRGKDEQQTVIVAGQAHPCDAHGNIIVKT